MTLKEEITAAENNYREKLVNYFTRIWGKTYLSTYWEPGLLKMHGKDSFKSLHNELDNS